MSGLSHALLPKPHGLSPDSLSAPGIVKINEVEKWNAVPEQTVSHHTHGCIVSADYKAPLLLCSIPQRLCGNVPVIAPENVHVLQNGGAQRYIHILATVGR